MSTFAESTVPLFLLVCLCGDQYYLANIINFDRGGYMAYPRNLWLPLAVLCAILSIWNVEIGAQRTEAPAAADLKTLARQSLANIDGEFAIPGLREPVEIIRDRWGVTHI